MKKENLLLFSNYYVLKMKTNHKIELKNYKRYKPKCNVDIVEQ